MLLDDGADHVVDAELFFRHVEHRLRRGACDDDAHAGAPFAKPRDVACVDDLIARVATPHRARESANALERFARKLVEQRRLRNALHRAHRFGAKALKTQASRNAGLVRELAPHEVKKSRNRPRSSAPEHVAHERARVRPVEDEATRGARGIECGEVRVAVTLCRAEFPAEQFADVPIEVKRAIEIEDHVARVLRNRASRELTKVEGFAVQNDAIHKAHVRAAGDTVRGGDLGGDGFEQHDPRA